MVREGYRKTEATVAGGAWVSLAPMVSDPEIYELAARVGHKLHAAERAHRHRRVLHRRVGRPRRSPTCPAVRSGSSVAT